jgi:hemolysin activation/secretion protein
MTYETLNRFTPVPSNGRSNTVGAYSTYALARSARSNKTLSFNLETRDYTNYTEGVEISKYNIKSATLGLQGNRFIGDAVWSWSLSGLYGQLSIDSASQVYSDQLYAKTEGGMVSFPFTA